MQSKTTGCLLGFPYPGRPPLEEYSKSSPWPCGRPAHTSLLFMALGQSDKIVVFPVLTKWRRVRPANSFPQSSSVHVIGNAGLDLGRDPGNVRAVSPHWMPWECQHVWLSFSILWALMKKHCPNPELMNSFCSSTWENSTSPCRKPARTVPWQCDICLHERRLQDSALQYTWWWWWLL